MEILRSFCCLRALNICVFVLCTQGQNCDEPIHACISNPCQNGGTCHLKEGEGSNFWWETFEIFYPTWLVLTVSLPASYVKETFSLIHTQISTCCVSGGTTPPVRLWRELFKVDSDDETGWDKKESIAVLHLKDVSIYLMGRIALWEIQENALMDQTFFKGTAMSEPHLHQLWPLFWTFHTIVF